MEIEIAKKIAAAQGTLAVYFTKPAGFVFRAGQYLDLTLISPPETDSEGNIRSFSIASAPQESDLMIATRLRDSAFKRVLKNLPDGSKLKAEGPLGSFTLHNNVKRPAVFLIGGIGITPVRSIIIDAAQRKLPHKLYLFYSNRTEKEAAFFDELMNLEKENSNFKFVPTMTGGDESKGGWKGEVGHIDSAMIKRYLDYLGKAIFYISGPPAMVGAMRKLLDEMGVDEDNIRSEEFSGY